MDRELLMSPIKNGYCWPTPKCRNVCVQHACFEDKKAKETSPRKSTPRTLKQVGQQYPEGFRDGSEAKTQQRCAPSSVPGSGDGCAWASARITRAAPPGYRSWPRS